MIRVDMTLMTDQVETLRRVAEENGYSVAIISGAVIGVLAKAESLDVRKARKIRQTVPMIDEHLSALDKLAMRWGINRSEAARRLICQAISQNVNFEDLTSRAASDLPVQGRHHRKSSRGSSQRLSCLPETE